MEFGDRPNLEIQLWQPGLLAGAKANVVAVAQQQLADASPLPPQAIGRGLVSEQPVGAPLFEQGVVATNGAVVDFDLTIAIATDLISTAMEGHHPGRLAWQVHQHLHLGGLDQPPPTTA